MAKPEYNCCFCLLSIGTDDLAAVAIGVSNLWTEDGVQGFAAHSACAVEHLNAAGLFNTAALRADLEI
jgi:hypothetical protein